MNEDIFREISDPSVIPAPLISVHMLAYRHERYLAQAIESVVAQVCDVPFELIIAEDCSPDGTLAVALRYQRQYPLLIRVLTADQNVGMHRNAARLIRVSRGRYYCACEGDDYWHHPRKLQMQIDLMRRHPEMAACHTDYDRLIGRRRKRGVHQKTRTPHLAVGNAYIDLLRAWTIMTATSMFRAEIVNDFFGSVFHRKDWPFGDWNLALYASQRGTIGYIPTSTAVWRKVYGSATNADSAGMLRIRLKVRECQLLFLEHSAIDPDLRRSILAETDLRILRDAFQANRIDEYRLAEQRLRDAHYPIPSLRHRLRLTLMRMGFPVMLFQMLRRWFLILTTRIL